MTQYWDAFQRWRREQTLPDGVPADMDASFPAIPDVWQRYNHLSVFGSSRYGRITIGKIGSGASWGTNLCIHEPTPSLTPGTPDPSGLYDTLALARERNRRRLFVGDQPDPTHFVR